MSVNDKDISIFGNISRRQEAALNRNEQEIARIALELDLRFLPQFERRTFTYVHDEANMASYLPAELQSDRNLFKTRSFEISYNYWPARTNPETAETIFCLGGIYNTARRFDFFAEGAAESFNVVAVDYPGKGYSGNFWMPNDYTLENYARIGRALIEEVDPTGKFHMIGHSHGSKVIYTMVEQGYTHQNWASTIIGDMPPETPDGPKLRRAWRNRERPLSPTIEQAVSRLENFLAGHGAPVDRDFVVHDFNHGFENFPREGYGWAYDPNSMQGYCDEYLKPYDKWDAYVRLPSEILILAGEKSNTATPEAMYRMVKERPDASLFVYEEVGHYPELVTPLRIAEVCDWVRNAGQTGPLRGLVPANPAQSMTFFNAPDARSAEAPPPENKKPKSGGKGSNPAPGSPP